MIRRRLDSGLDFYSPYLFQAITFCKVTPFQVVRDKLNTLQRSSHFLPARYPAIQLCKIGFQIFLKCLLMLRRVTRQSRGDGLRYNFTINRIQIVMRISFRVNISLRPVDTSRRLKHIYPNGTINVPYLPWQNPRITRNLEKRWKPGDLQIQPDQEKKISAVQLGYKTGLNRDCMHELYTFCQALNVHKVLSYLLRHVSQIRNRSNHADLLSEEQISLKPDRDE